MGKMYEGLDRPVGPARGGVMGGYRWSALALWVGGLLAVFVRFLFLASHGPTGFDEKNQVLGLTQQDFERWSVFPLLLVLWGLAGLHQFQSGEYGRRGRRGYRLTAVGYGLVLFGVVWSFVLFDPFGHPLHPVGFLVWLVGLVVVVVGWVVWGRASFAVRSLPRWALPVPFLVAIGSVSAVLFDEELVDALSINGVAGTQIVQAAGFLVLGMVLWRADKTQEPISARSRVG